MFQSPLTEVKHRKAIRRALENASYTYDANAPQNDDPSFPNPQPPGIVRQLQLEQAFASLDASFVPMLPKNGEISISFVRDVSSGLSKYYRELPSQLSGNGQIEKLMMLDGRDASRVTARQGNLHFPRLGLNPPPRRPSLAIAIEPESELVLSDSDWTDVNVVFSTVNAPEDALRPFLAFDEDRIVVQDVDGRGIKGGNQPRIAIQSDGNARLTLRVKARLATTDTANVQPLELIASCGSLNDRISVDCKLPRPNDIQLVVTQWNNPERPAAARIARIDESNQVSLRLRPFPNRTSQFRLALKNLSGEAKEVSVQIFRIADSKDRAWPAGRLPITNPRFRAIRDTVFEFDSWRPRAGAEMVAQTAAPVSLSANAEPVELDFSPAPPPPPAADGTAPPTTVAQPAQDKSEADVQFGLVCLLVNTANPDERWVKWIELHPLTPHDYLDTKVRYAQEKLHVEVRAKSQDVLPPDIAANPIEIEWHTDWLRMNNLNVGGRVESGQILDGVNPVLMYAEVPKVPNNKADVILSADGYPRAFSYRIGVDNDNSNADADLPLEARKLRIMKLRASHFNREYLTSALAKAGPQGEGQPETVKLRDDDFAAFPVPTRRDALTIQFEIDVPRDAFGIGERDVIEVQLRGSSIPPVRLYSDRQLKFWLADAGKGFLSIRSRVSDHEVSLPLNDMSGSDFDLAIQLNADGPTSQKRKIVFDGQPPRVPRFSLSRGRVELGEKINVQVGVEEDLSGLDSLVLGFSDKRDGAIGEPGKRTINRSQLKDPDTFTWDTFKVGLTTADLEKPGSYWVKATFTDRVGHTTETDGKAGRPSPCLLLVRPPKEADSGEPEVIGTLKGIVQLGKHKADGIVVRLKGGNVKPVKTSGGGRFQFMGIKPGTYTLEAAGVVKNNKRSGKLEDIQIQKQADFDRDWTIELN